ncbi:outer mitochondrial transmembrane helix translocase-like [Tubulanus polymorphus]|uniref:outer mitochondrial transmembrane helix translocase-like n=1 Tax=Tubulanus polymorphus TaxID=672921 RepID=UPI003DA4E38E
MNKPEVVARIASTLVGLTVSFAVTYCGVKWLANALDPTKQEKQEAHKRAEEILKRIGLKNVKLTEYELCIAANLVDPLAMVTSWEDIGGLEETIEDIQETVILPFKRRDLFSGSSLLTAPKGVLLYGPPGCGKTMIAKACAKAAGARFINLQVTTLVDKWYGESQKRAEAVFSLAVKLQPTIIFIDEIDSFLRVRSSGDHESTAMMKTQFMSFWDGLITDPKCQIMIIGATNRPQDVDAAILRRMPSMFHIGLPTKEQREQILKLILEKEDVEPNLSMLEISDKTEGFSGSDLRELCRAAAIYRVREFMRSESLRSLSDEFRLNESIDSNDTQQLRPILKKDILSAVKKMRTTNHISQRLLNLPDLD